jgi:hypothetical protein
MKRLTLAVCLLFPVFLMAMDNNKKGGSPRKMPLPRGLTTEVSQQLAEFDSKSASPVPPERVGFFSFDRIETESDETAAANEQEAPAFEQQSVASNTLVRQDVHLVTIETRSNPPHMAMRQEDPLSPANRSNDWRYSAQPAAPEGYDPFFMKRSYRQQRQWAVIGVAVHCHKKGQR